MISLVGSRLYKEDLLKLKLLVMRVLQKTRTDEGSLKPRIEDVHVQYGHCVINRLFTLSRQMRFLWTKHQTVLCAMQMLNYLTTRDMSQWLRK